VTRREVHIASRPALSHAADAVVADGLVFVAGILPVDEAGALVAPGDVVGQARHVLNALGAVLAEAGSTVADVVKVTLYLTDVAGRPLVNPVRQEVFGDPRPASTLVEVPALAVPGALIELDAVAVTA
jgi:enamine deaminase RidA (YjgF/YER057c/UK114 family)